MTFQDLVQTFHTYLVTERRASHNTVQAYMTDLEQVGDYFKEHNVSVQNLTADELKKYLSHLKDQGLSARSMARKISTLKAFYAYLAEKHSMENIAQGLIFPKLEKRLPTVISEEEVEHLLKIADADHSALGVRNSALLYLLYTTGMRISELVNAKVADIQFDAHIIKVHGKGSKERLIPLPTPIMPLVQKYVKQLQASPLGESDYLFPTRYRGQIKPISRQAAWVILKKLWKQTGSAKSLSPHQLRHSLATHLLKKGADLRSLQKLLGHENVSTVQVYTHVETSHLRDVYDKKHPRS